MRKKMRSMSRRWRALGGASLPRKASNALTAVSMAIVVLDMIQIPVGDEFASFPGPVMGLYILYRNEQGWLPARSGRSLPSGDGKSFRPDILCQVAEKPALMGSNAVTRLTDASIRRSRTNLCRQ